MSVFIARWRGASLAFALAAALVSAPALAAPVEAKAQGRPVSVTLITGDRVDLDGQGRLLRVLPGPGRRAINFVTVQQSGRLAVTPSDAGPLVQQGVVDARLFNISMLLRYGYDDAKRGDMPTIARGIAGSPADATASAARSAQQATRLQSLGMRAPRELVAVRAFSGGVDKRQAHVFWNQVRLAAAGAVGSAQRPRLWLDGVRAMLLDHSVPQIGAPAAWAAGYTGRGIKVAVLDSGLDATHPDFAGRIVASGNFSDEDATDVVGHGTHVASIAVGNGAASGGQYKGVAYEASLIVGKVCNTNGCPESSMLAGMQWAAVTQGARVINMSIGATDGPTDDPLEDAVNTLSASTGVLFVASAGNAGCATPSVASPGTARAALSVGAVDGSDKIAGFSSCGPRAGDYGVKPEITAPGVNIVAARSSTSSFTPQGPGGAYTTLSGTSMSSPHVAGAAALVAQQHPEWNGQQIKASLIGSALQAAGVSAFVQGSGRVDLANQLSQVAVALQPNTAFGVQLWPHADDAVRSSTVTFSNTSAQARVLNLSVNPGATNGVTPPPGMFYLSRSQITVPAGGTASVDLYSNTTVNVADAAYAGTLSASDGVVTTRALFSIYKEVESYNLTLSHIDRQGQPSGDFFTSLRNMDSTNTVDLSGGGDSSAFSLRLTKGRYIGLATFNGSTGTDLVFAPEVNVNRDTQLTFDARRTAPWRTSVPDTQATLFNRQITASHWNTGVPGEASMGMLSFSAGQELRFGAVSQARRVPDFALNLLSAFGRNTASGVPSTAFPMTVTLDALSTVPTGFVKTYAAADLARVTVLPPPAASRMTSVATMYAETPGALSFFNNSLQAVTDEPLVFLLSRGPTSGWSSELSLLPKLPNALFTESFIVLNRAAQQFQAGSSTTIDQRAPGPFSPSLNASWRAYEVSPLPGQVYGDPAVKLAPMLRRPSTDPTVDLMLISFSEYGTASGDDGPLYLPGPAPGLKHITLMRNGVLEVGVDLSRSAAVALPVAAVDGDYTLREEVPSSGSLGSFLGLPTSSVTQWAFHSVKGTPQRWDTLPVSIIRLGAASAVSGSPITSKSKVPAAGPRMAFGLSVLRQQAVAPRADAGSQLTVKVSYDGGVSWVAAALTPGAAGTWTATADMPATGQTVSVQASAVSLDGSTVQQTLIDVFPVGSVR